jgi:histidine triad (HIT) family protein
MAESGCLFCRIVAAEVPATIVRESARVLTFRDINPQAPTHVLVIPKEHYADIASLAAADEDLLVEVVREAAAVAEDEGLTGRGFRVVTNIGAEAGQTVDHVHLHVLGGRTMTWPPG